MKFSCLDTIMKNEATKFLKITKSKINIAHSCTSHQLIAATTDKLAFSAGSACHAADVCHVRCLPNVS
jgi:hypothetical protein